MKKESIICMLLLCVSAGVFAQTAYQYGLPKGKEFDRWSVGVVGGISNLQSDLKNPGDAVNSIHSIKLQGIYGGHVGFQLSHSIGINVQGLWGNFSIVPTDAIYIKAIDKSAYLDYHSTLTEYTGNLIFSFGNISFVKRNTNLHLVLKAGAGTVIAEPTLKYSYDKKVYNNYNKPSKVSNFIVPFGVGARYRFGKFNVGIDYDYRKTFTDKLDGFQVTNSDYDGYSVISAQLNYIIGKKHKAMEWVNPMELIYNDLGTMKAKIDSLTNDKDKDGVPDLFDRDNATPEGAKVYGDGTAVDTDGDNIPDNIDADPYSARGAKVDATGKEIDSDNDGVPDSRDKEPNTPAGKLVNFEGITIGGQGSSSTANTTNVTNNNGGVGFFPSLFFDLNKSDVKTAYYERLLTIARVMKVNPDLVVKIVGSTDQKGNADANNKLGLRRAEAAKAHLVNIYGIPPERFITETKGKNEPLASKSETTDYLNRRVDFIIEAGTIKK